MTLRLPVCWGIILVAAAAAGRADEAFDYGLLQSRAKALAAQPYRENQPPAAGWLGRLSYDEYRDIRFDEQQTWWRAETLPFQLQFFHPGGSFIQPVRIFEVRNSLVRPIAFSPRFYDYRKARGYEPLPAGTGFAGFKVLHELNQPGKWDELVSFLGASYFRALGRGLHYGLSARGLAINTGEPGGEEFPAFEKFWIVRPAPGDTTLVIFALLNGPSVAGAYRFELRPGAETVMRVRAAVYFRQSPMVLGLAPLTSMFAHGENTGWSREDFRPEVHDSDGLQLESATGEWLWRPLDNPKAMRLTVIPGPAPRGFGLLQRDRDFEHYGDLEAYYHQRPSAWVEPVGDWGRGAVRLMELPTTDEYGDNIVACWEPTQLPAAGEALEFEYNLHWRGETGLSPAGQVTSTRTSLVPGPAGIRRYVIEFAGPVLAGQPAEADITASLTVGSGGRQSGRTVVQKNRFNGAWRVVFEVAADPGATVELRCHLRQGPQVLSETWNYLWNP